MTQRLDVPGGTLAFDDAGSGPLVLMAPGLGDLRQQYRFLGPRLVKAGYRVVTLDLRGHGDSSVEWPSYDTRAVGGDLIALLEHLGGGQAVLVGNSFAAGAAVWAAAERPDAVRRLVLIGPFVREHALGPVMRVAMRVAFGGPWRVRAWDAYFATLFPTRQPDDLTEYRRRLRANLAEPGRFQAVAGMMWRQDAPLIEARLVDVRAPSLVVMGSKDPDFPDAAEEARWIAERLGGEVAMIDGAGHYPHVEMPERAEPAILEFLSNGPGA